MVVHKDYTAYLFLWWNLTQVEIKGMCLTLPHSTPVITGVIVGDIESLDVVLAQVLWSLLISMLEIGTSIGMCLTLPHSIPVITCVNIEFDSIYPPY